MIFLRDVLQGRKQLLKVSETQAIPKVPHFQEIDVRVLWSEIKIDSKFSSFFPDMYVKKDYVPDRTYFFTV